MTIRPRFPHRSCRPPSCAHKVVAPDLALFRAWREGDQGAGDRLLLRLRARYLRYFRGLGPATVDDLVQELLVACLRARDTLRDERALHAYLRRVARRILARELALRDGQPLPFDEEVSPAARHGAIDIERLDAVRLLRAQAPGARKILVDYYLRGHRAPEIARAQQTSIGTIRSRIRYGLKDLQERARDPGCVGGGSCPSPGSLGGAETPLADSMAQIESTVVHTQEE
ncbi:MAG: sigma-70 family RNA polymerase sigma factor [Myxococcales bacterium]|nr:sigma-70 family RNA polymerase sigma factor [Myxococcales bacterium]